MALDTGTPTYTTGTRETVEVEEGARGAGEYRCLACGYGIATFSVIPACPMCRGTRWEPAGFGPFTTREREQMPED
jgi:rubrerythrin